MSGPEKALLLRLWKRGFPFTKIRELFGSYSYQQVTKATKPVEKPASWPEQKGTETKGTELANAFADIGEFVRGVVLRAGPGIEPMALLREWEEE